MKSPLSTDEKLALVRRMEDGERVSALATGGGVLRKSLYEWRAAYRAFGAAGLNRKRGPKPGGRAAAAPSSPPTPSPQPRARPTSRPTISPRRKRAHRRARAAGRPSAGGPRFFSRSLAVMGREAPRERRAHLFAVIEEMTRERPQGEPDTNAARIAHLIEIAKLVAGELLSLAEPKLSARDDADLRDLIQRLALHAATKAIGGSPRAQRRRPHRQRQARARLMRADNLLSLRRKPFVPPTTDSRHKFKIVPNLARFLEPTGLDQLWVADITYVRLAEGFVYLAVVVDAFSRKVVG